MFLKSPSPKSTAGAQSTAGARLVLASTSRYRRELLARLGLPFDVESPGVDESALPGETPAALAERLASNKARVVALRRSGDWVIGSDQVAVIDADDGRGAVLGKPGSTERCIEQLRECSGRSVRFLTAAALVRSSPPAAPGAAPEVLEHRLFDVTTVRFRRLDDAEIERYVARESPLDCAGGFKVEGLGVALFEAVHSTDPTALVGLPLIGLAAALREVGMRVP